MAVAVDTPTTFAAPGQPGSVVELKSRYDNFIGGEWIPPSGGEYRENLTPVTGEPFCEVAHSTPADVELALDAAHAAKDEWGRRSPAERAAVLDAIADAMQENLVSIPERISAAQASTAYFQPYHYTSFPVVNEQGQAVGLLSVTQIEALGLDSRSTHQVAEIVDRDPELILTAGEDVAQLLERSAFARFGRAVVIASTQGPSVWSRSPTCNERCVPPGSQVQQ
jgi:Aldehyde dehydrogenase family